VVLADAGRGDWILCQVTSKPYGDHLDNQAGRYRFLHWVAASLELCPSRQTFHCQSGSHRFGSYHTEIAIVEAGRRCRGEPPPCGQCVMMSASLREALPSKAWRLPLAVTVFYDPLSATFDDPDHSVGERRFITVGNSVHGKLLTGSHTEHGKAIRIISARPATRHERKRHET